MGASLLALAKSIYYFQILFWKGVKDFRCGFCGCVALSNAFELHFCSWKDVFQRFTSFVGYDRSLC